MRGIVLDCSTEKDSGILRCDNGHRYPFLGQDWHSELLPRAGQDVDFVVEGDVAADIYLLRHGTSSISAMALVSFITGIFGLFFGYRMLVQGQNLSVINKVFFRLTIGASIRGSIKRTITEVDSHQTAVAGTLPHQERDMKTHRAS